MGGLECGSIANALRRCPLEELYLSEAQWLAVSDSDAEGVKQSSKVLWSRQEIASPKFAFGTKRDSGGETLLSDDPTALADSPSVLTEDISCIPRDDPRLTALNWDLA